jgi:hypothetical protein
MNALNIAKTVIANGYLVSPENRYGDGQINWNFISADLHIDCAEDISHIEEDLAYDLLEECIALLVTKVLH